ncbi:uncharacterized protein LOC144147231 [Haemaphysalis longicornis]
MNEENAYGKDAERPERPRPQPIYSLRWCSAPLQNPDVYGSAFPLGVLVPLYLMPLLFVCLLGLLTKLVVVSMAIPWSTSWTGPAFLAPRPRTSDPRAGRFKKNSSGSVLSFFRCLLYWRT